MATIDAAIIKALVEHIGMDPDDVGGNPDSINSGVRPATWMTVDAGDHQVVAFSLPDVVELKYGDTIILGDLMTGDRPKEFYLTQILYPGTDENSSQYMKYRFEGVHDNNIAYLSVNMAEVEGRMLYGCDKLYMGENMAGLPDNKTTGLFEGSPLVRYIVIKSITE